MPWAILAGSLISAGSSAIQSASAKADQKKTQQNAEKLAANAPKIGKDPNADFNLALLKSELSNGMSAKAEQAYKDIDQSNFSTTLGSFLKGGGDVNDVGTLYGTSQEGALKLSLVKDNLRLNQIKNLLEQSKEVDERNYVTPFQVNEFAPWENKVAANAVARSQAAKKQSDANNTFTSSLESGISGLGEYYRYNGRGDGNININSATHKAPVDYFNGDFSAYLQARNKVGNDNWSKWNLQNWGVK